MYYKLKFLHDYDEALYPFCYDIFEACLKSEFQFLSREQLTWDIPSRQNFEFQDCYCVDDKVPVYSRRLWDRLTSSYDTDGIFSIPLVINYCGEQHFYCIAVPPRINCLDYMGRIMTKNVGRYQMFKSMEKGDNSIYVCGNMAEQLKNFSSLILKGVDLFGNRN